MSLTDPRAVAAQLWCLPQHAHKEMDVEFTESIAHALADAERRGLERAATECDQRLSNCRTILEQQGYRRFQPGELAVWRANATLLEGLGVWIRAQVQADKEGVMDESSLLGIRLKMERRISEREAMKALNEWRASRGEAQAYDEEAFFNNANAFAELGHQLQQEAPHGTDAE